MKVKVKLFLNGKMPTYTREGDACLDCYARVDEEILMPGSRCYVPLGFALGLPKGYEAIIRPRSGLSGKNIDIALGTVDSNYTGELKALVINNSDRCFYIHDGDRICQLAIRKTENVDFVEVDELEDTNRGSAGFGSSGIN